MLQSTILLYNKCYLTQHQGIYDFLLKTLPSVHTFLQFLHFQIINLVSNKNVFIIVLCFESTDPITSSVYVRLNCSFGTNTFIFPMQTFHKLGDLDICASSCRNISIAKNKGGVTNIQRLKIKLVRIQVRFKSKSMVIFYGETWSILQTAWLNCSKVVQATFSRGRLFQ